MKGTIDSIVTHQFDTDERLTIYTPTSGTKAFKERCIFDKQGNVIWEENETEIITYKIKDQFIEEIVSKGNPYPKVLTLIEHGEESAVYIWHNMLTDEKTKLDTLHSTDTLRCSFDKGSERLVLYKDELTSIIQYDTENKIQKSEIFLEGQLNCAEQYIYAEGLLTTSIYEEGDHTVHVTAYEYTKFDSKKNWIERLVRIDDEKPKMEMRQIYYR